MLGDDSVDLVGQEDEVSEGNAGLDVPLGVRDDRVAPALTRVEVNGVLEGWVAVAEGGEGWGEVVEEGQKQISELERFMTTFLRCLSLHNDLFNQKYGIQKFTQII